LDMAAAVEECRCPRPGGGRTSGLQLRRCMGMLGPAAVQPRAAELAVRRRREAPRRDRYWRLAAKSKKGVPETVYQQISIDVARTFSSLPEPRGLICRCCGGAAGRWGWSAAPGREALLTSVLLAYEWRAMCLLQEQRGRPERPGDPGRAFGGTGDEEDDESPSYVQGCSFLAAMCLGFVGGAEEDCFWLLLHLIEDVLGPDFLARCPALVGYHGDRAAAAALVAAEAPLLLGALGAQRLAEAVSAVAARCLLSGFVGFLADEPLLALWQELLETRYPAYPRFPLLAWLAGLVCSVEAELIALVKHADESELVPIFFKEVQAAGLSLPVGWRPRLRHPEHRLEELRRVSEGAADAFRRNHEERRGRELHARRISRSLDRAAASLSGALQAARVFTAVGGDSGAREGLP